MLDIINNKSENVIKVVGAVKEFQVEFKERVGNKQGNFAIGKLVVKVDQEYGGVMYENEIPVQVMAAEFKKPDAKGNQGAPNKIYSSLIKAQEDIISMGSLDESELDKATIVNLNCQVRENKFLAKNGTVICSPSISTNFINEARGDAQECATFELSGVVGKKIVETNGDGDETGRLKVKLIVIGYMGSANVVDLVAESPAAVNFIQGNWEEGDTVSVTGYIVATFKQETYYEEQGFGEPIKRCKTVAKREYVINGGEYSKDEDDSYDATDIKEAMAKREREIEELKNKDKIKKPTASNGFGF